MAEAQRNWQEAVVPQPEERDMLGIRDSIQLSAKRLVQTEMEKPSNEPLFDSMRQQRSSFYENAAEQYVEAAFMRDAELLPPKYRKALDSRIEYSKGRLQSLSGTFDLSTLN